MLFIRKKKVQVFALLLCWGITTPAYAGVDIGPLTIGGALRANYILGDYEESGGDGPERGGNGGDVELDTFRINLDFEKDSWIGKAEYRWYSGYNFLHTGWAGYQFSESARVEAGLTRVPFGVGDYGPANSWFFDQHYYVGLSDDMDMGVKYTTRFGSLAVDLAYFAAAEPSFNGDSPESARYSYDIVDNGGEYSHYKERNQVNARARYGSSFSSWDNELGVSLQWGQLKADEAFAEDSDAWAVSVHDKITVGNWAFMLQLTSYRYDADYHAETGLTNDLITMGAYDFAWPVASEGVIPAAAASYTWTPDLEWIDSITFYNDFSVIIKDGELPDGRDFNNSAMNVTGMAIASGGWYIYVDYAYSNGNYFVGDEGDIYGGDYAASQVGDFGASLNDDWNGRFNINLGYYF
ncbi:MAG: hypothetical protein RBR09_00020 [Desulfobulbaceae bacterium]|jgi:hypothetical protein|nr:hypothetical protein [Desulfobulbaceae bacterium]MDY0349614.1 hypothetical protein [Desulfobulbaceae bacterium]